MPRMSNFIAEKLDSEEDSAMEDKHLTHIAYTFGGIPAKVIEYEGETWLAVKMSDLDNEIYKTQVVFSGKTQETR